MRKFEAGQVWSYDNRKNESESLVIILKIDNENEEIIIHICVVDLIINNPNNLNEPLNGISHMPFTKSAFEQSIVEFIDVTEVPSFAEEYQIWKESFEKGEAGVFSISIGSAIGYMENALNEGS